MSFILGIDGGGTGCRAALATPDGRVLARAASGAANIRTDLENARIHIVEAVQHAFAAAGHDPALMAQTPALLGLAGANVGTYGEQLRAILPFRRSRVESDAEIALEGAVGAGDGAIAVLGTGSAYRVRRGGVSRAIGGWGFQVGDQASGARIGRDLLEQALLAHDGIREASPLTRDIMGVFHDSPGEVVAFALAATPRDYAAFAARVFGHAAEGDAVGRHIVANAVADIEAALAALDLRDGEALCLLGGLAGLYAPLLGPRYRARLSRPQGDALDGAVRMAVRLFGTGGAEAGDG